MVKRCSDAEWQAALASQKHPCILCGAEIPDKTWSGGDLEYCTPCLAEMIDEAESELVDKYVELMELHRQYRERTEARNAAIPAACDAAKDKIAKLDAERSDPDPAEWMMHVSGYTDTAHFGLHKKTEACETKHGCRPASAKEIMGSK